MYDKPLRPDNPSSIYRPSTKRDEFGDDDFERIVGPFYNTMLYMCIVLLRLFYHSEIYVSILSLFLQDFNVLVKTKAYYLTDSSYNRKHPIASGPTRDSKAPTDRASAQALCNSKRR